MASSLTNLSKVTVITNSFPLVTMLMKYESKELFTGDIIFLGGYVNSKHFRASGSLAERMAKDFYVNKAFISLDGIHPNSGITRFDIEKCLLSKTFIQNASETYILADHAKLNVKATYKIGSLAEIDYFITNVPMPMDWNIQDLNWITY